MFIKYVFAVCLLCAVLLPALPARAAETLDIPVSSSVRALESDGRYVIWLEQEADDVASRALMALSLQTGQRKVITMGLPHFSPDTPDTTEIDHMIAIDRGVVVWVEGSGAQRAIQAQRIESNESWTVATGNVSHPAIAGDVITWWEGIDRQAAARPDPLPATLKARNIATQAPVTVLAQTPNTLYGFGVSRASSSWVVWSQATGGGLRGSRDWQISAVPISGGTPRVVGDPGVFGPDSFDLLRFSNNLVYSQLQGTPAPNTPYTVSLVSVNLDTNESVTSGPHGMIGRPEIEDRYVFWQKTTEQFNDWDLWGYDTQTDSAFLIAADQATLAYGGGPQSFVAFPGGFAWLTSDAAQRTTLHVRPTREVLPIARRPGATSSDQLYFPETGHTLGGSFRAFWERNGGLWVFGYPLTEEFIERTPGSSQGFTVQYFERQRYEFHPENRGTPYEVLLGRLGVEALQRQGIDWRTLPTASPSAPHYFAATGHAIAPEFWGAWRGQGLELGDGAVSEREALALWGYPISEPQRETNSSGDTVLTQWFERARFEYHPNQSPGWRVLIGRLAADLIAERW